MELTVTQENFARALSAVSRVASNKTGLPILSNILLRTDNNRLLVAATNLEIATTQYIGAKITKPGALTIPARLISEFVNNLPKDTIKLQVINNNLHISSGKFTSIINGVIADEFPELPTINEASSISYTIHIDDFKQAVNQTIITASSDTTRPVLTGVYWHSHEGQLYLSATDGYRLSERRLVETKSDVSAIIPVQTLQEALRTIVEDSDTVDILFDETQVRFRINDAEIISRLVDGNFPDYRQLIPAKSDINVTVNKQEFIRVTKIAGLFARESGGSVTVTVDADNKSVSLHSIASEYGENTSELSAEVTGSGQVTLNSRYLTEALSVIEGDTIEFSFTGKLSPCILKSVVKDVDYYHVIMPLKS
ncbi:MAG: DNA polymerase III subunit beta [Candidatus Microsaccharimonas sossegonensis]|uniref:Beta sliding clamp n=1 Tax=Candidatus Microsaccharimonas sossegonensis TaxID=2506948 RepID=A0A4Q0AGS3_9BACT|nr:MAG: DNA polymerase III subunit beta [Candidatus Microsaccharimonas sossegonensis]